MPGSVYAAQKSLEAGRAWVDMIGAEQAVKEAQDAVAKFDPNQPRAPAGAPEGGQWTGGGGAPGTPADSALRYHTEVRDGPREIPEDVRRRMQGMVQEMNMDHESDWNGTLIFDQGDVLGQGHYKADGTIIIGPHESWDDEANRLMNDGGAVADRVRAKAGDALQKGLITTEEHQQRMGDADRMEGAVLARVGKLMEDGRDELWREHSSYAFSDPYEGCARHEFGHAVGYRALKNLRDPKHRETFSQVAGLLAAGGTIQKTTWDAFARQHGATARARDGFHEWFAETWALTVAGKKGFQSRESEELFSLLMQTVQSEVIKGGAGSGHWAHEGNPPHVGGSRPGGGHHRLPMNAEALLSRVTEAEPEITAALSGATAAGGGELVGLDHRFKTAEGIERKALWEVSHGVPEAIAYHRVHDALRYTVRLSPENYVSGTKEIFKQLRAAGLEVYDKKLRNFWGTKNYGYWGLNTNWQDKKTGAIFEVQFHTRQSYHAKETLNHKTYQRQRALPPGDSRWGKYLVQMQRNVERTVPPPPQIETLAWKVKAMETLYWARVYGEEQRQALYIKLEDGGLFVSADGDNWTPCGGISIQELNEGGDWIAIDGIKK